MAVPPTPATVITAVLSQLSPETKCSNPTRAITVSTTSCDSFRKWLVKDGRFNMCFFVATVRALIVGHGFVLAFFFPDPRHSLASALPWRRRSAPIKMTVPAAASK
jgi:hypothetical protein